MEGLEFYMFEDELWCKTSDGKNFMVDETHTELVKYIRKHTRRWRRFTPRAHLTRVIISISWCVDFANATFVDSTLRLLMSSMLTRMEGSTSRRSNAQCVVNALMIASSVCQGLMLIFLLRSCAWWNCFMRDEASRRQQPSYSTPRTRYIST